MATGKNSVIVYIDLIHVIEKLTDEQAGQYFKHFLRYVNDMNPIAPDNLIDLIFEPQKQQLKRDLKDWENTREKRSASGKLGGIKSGEARKQNEANEASASNLKQNEANEAVTVTVNDTVIVTVTDTEKEEIKHTCFSFDEFWNMYDKKLDTKACKEKYDKLPESDREKIKITLPIYLSTIRDKQYQKHPKTYLNNKNWNDDVYKTAQLPAKRKVHYMMFDQPYTHFEKAYIENLAQYGADKVQFLNYIEDGA